MFIKFGHICRRNDCIPLDAPGTHELLNVTYELICAASGNVCGVSTSTYVILMLALAHDSVVGGLLSRSATKSGHGHITRDRSVSWLPSWQSQSGLQYPVTKNSTKEYRRDTKKCELLLFDGFSSTRNGEIKSYII